MSLRPKLDLVPELDRSRTAIPSQALSDQRDYMMRWREANRDRYNAKQREWRTRNKEMLSKRNVERRKLGIERMTKEELVAFRRAECAKAKRLADVVKEEVFKAYGGWVCNCCGEREKAFLTIDHVNNDGCEKRKEHGHSNRFYRWLRRNGYPDGYQVLCMNCNFGKHMNDGVCPHQGRRNDHSLEEVGPSGPKRVAPDISGDEMICSTVKAVAA